MHDNVVLGGPVWWFAAAMMVLAVLLGLFTFFDSLFIRRAAFERLREPRWSYTVAQGAYLLTLGAAQVPGVPTGVSGVAVIATPFSIALSLAYLLRAVYPKPTEEPDGSSNAALPQEGQNQQVADYPDQVDQGADGEALQ